MLTKEVMGHQVLLHQHGQKMCIRDSCSADGFACLLGTPLSAVQLSECSNAVKRIASLTSNDVLRAKRMAVATIASSNFLCD